MPNGVVTRVLAGFFDVTDDTLMYRCRARGILKKKGVHILVGDRVLYAVTGTNEGIIDDVLPRTSELVRPPVANVTHALLVFSVANPQFQSYLLDKALVVTAAAGLAQTVVLTKADLLSETELRELRAPYDAAGLHVLAVSLVDGRGVEDVRKAIHGHVSVFVGPSGVGKSSLGNALSPDLGLKMGELSEKLGRGKHTTRHTELFQVDTDTYVADAAGFSQLRVELPSTELRRYFPDFSKWIENCPYRGCLHMDEEDCGVKRAVEEGVLDKGRYESYRGLYEEVRHKEETMY